MPLKCSPGTLRKRGSPAPVAMNTASKPSSLHQLVDGHGLADDDVGLELHAAAAQHVDLEAHNVLRQTELRNAIHQHSAELVQRFEDVHLVAHLDEVAGAGQSGRAAADDGDFLAGRRRCSSAIRTARSRAPNRRQSAPDKRCRRARPSCPARIPTRTDLPPGTRGR